MDDQLLEYYDYIRRFAESKCSSYEDAEDLVSETFLDALAYLRRGGVIEYPKTWLANTFMHKFNSMLRKRYSQPPTVDIFEADNIAADEGDDELIEEAERVRREINYLSKTTREVMIRYYYNGQTISDIAYHMGLPSGTVKSRLSAGREKIKEGFTQMNEARNNIPGTLNLSISGSEGLHGEPMSCVEDDLIAQNLLISAYERPLTAVELANALGIPTVYIEPIIRKLTNAELMVETDGKRYYTDFIIYRPEDLIRHFPAQQKFIKERFDRIWNILSNRLNELDQLDFVREMNVHSRTKLERYFLLCALQRFQLRLSDNSTYRHPNRRDGGSWTASGYYTPSGYQSEELDRVKEYSVIGGHRTDGGECDHFDAKFLQMVEFDTTLWDNPHRFAVCGYELYFNEIRKLLWCIYKKLPVENSGISSAMIEKLPDLIKCTGLIIREDGELKVDIPIVEREDFKRISSLIEKCFDELKSELGGEYAEYLKGNMLSLPKHLKGVSDMYRYLPATECIVMLVIREAYERGLHLADVDYCCPPVVLIYEEKQK